MGRSQALPNGVVVEEVFVEGLVCPQDGLGKTSGLQEVIQESALMLIKALPNVSAASSKSLTKQAGFLALEAKKIPGVLGTSRSRGASKEFLVFPIFHPRAKLAKANGRIEPVHLRKNSQPPIFQRIEAGLRPLSFIEPSVSASQRLLGLGSSSFDRVQHGGKPLQGVAAKKLEIRCQNTIQTSCIIFALMDALMKGGSVQGRH